MWLPHPIPHYHQESFTFALISNQRQFRIVFPAKADKGAREPIVLLWNRPLATFHFSLMNYLRSNRCSSTEVSNAHHITLLHTPGLLFMFACVTRPDDWWIEVANSNRFSLESLLVCGQVWQPTSSVKWAFSCTMMWINQTIEIFPVGSGTGTGTRTRMLTIATTMTTTSTTMMEDVMWLRTTCMAQRTMCNARRR